MPLKYILIVPCFLLASIASADGDERRITVTGEGRVEVAPDMATIQVGVTTEAQAAREALDENARAMEGVLSRLRGAGIGDRDLQTSNFSVSPRYDYERSSGTGALLGFVAQNMLTVRVRDRDRLGETLDAVARDGANSFSGLSFGLQDPGPVEDAARAAAVAEARRKAVLYAEAADVTLGALMTLSESDGGRPRPVAMAQSEMRAASDSVPVAAGELAVIARVTLVYAID